MTPQQIADLSSATIDKFELAQTLVEEANNQVEQCLEPLVKDLIDKLGLTVSIDVDYESNDEGGTDAYYNIHIDSNKTDGAAVSIRSWDETPWVDALQGVCQAVADQAFIEDEDISESGLDESEMNDAALALRDSLLVWQLDPETRKRVMGWLDDKKILFETGSSFYDEESKARGFNWYYPEN